MKKIAIAFAAIAGFVVPASPALAATAHVAGDPASGTSVTTEAGPAPVVVARYSFDSETADGQVVDTSGKGQPLTVRTKDAGAIKFTGGYIQLPGACPSTTAPCPRALLETPSTDNLNPGTQTFRWSARVNVQKSQLKGSSNVLQKGTVGSQWKLQIGGNGRALCTASGAAGSFQVRSSVSVADGNWHKVMCERSGTALRVLVDDQVKGSATIPATLSISNTKPLRVAGANFNTKSDMFHGQLDDVYAELG